MITIQFIDLISAKKDVLIHKFLLINLIKKRFELVCLFGK
jgi:hypothetical protein